MYKAFEKVHTVVARSTFVSEHVKSQVFGPLFDDCHSMSNKCTPLWREARLQVKSVKAGGFEPIFDVSDLVLLTDR